MKEIDNFVPVVADSSILDKAFDNLADKSKRQRVWQAVSGGLALYCAVKFGEETAPPSDDQDITQAALYSFGMTCNSVCSVMMGYKAGKQEKFTVAETARRELIDEYEKRDPSLL